MNDYVVKNKRAAFAHCRQTDCMLRIEAVLISRSHDGITDQTLLEKEPHVLL